MNQSSLDSLDHLIRAATRDLFAAYGVPLTDNGIGASFSGEVYAATIGFTHTAFRGALIITLCRDLVVKSLPSQISSPAPGHELTGDWAGELSNQLLGRIKKKLIAYGVGISLSTPVVFRGTGLCNFPQPAVVSRSHCFSSAAGPLEVVFQARADAGFELVETGDPDAGGPAEGEVSLF